MDEQGITIQTITIDPRTLLDELRARLVAYPEDDLSRISYAVQLFLAGHFHEATLQAELVVPISPPRTGTTVRYSKLEARKELVAAFQRVKPIYERHFESAHPDNGAMLNAAAEQFSFWQSLIEKEPSDLD